MLFVVLAIFDALIILTFLKKYEDLYKIKLSLAGLIIIVTCYKAYGKTVKLYIDYVGKHEKTKVPDSDFSYNDSNFKK